MTNDIQGDTISIDFSFDNKYYIDLAAIKEPKEALCTHLLDTFGKVPERVCIIWHDNYMYACDLLEITGDDVQEYLQSIACEPSEEATEIKLSDDWLMTYILFEMSESWRWEMHRVALEASV